MMTSTPWQPMWTQLDGGGDGLGIIISLLIIVLLVVVILQVSGHKIIIKK